MSESQVLYSQKERFIVLSLLN